MGYSRRALFSGGRQVSDPSQRRIAQPAYLTFEHRECHRITFNQTVAVSLVLNQLRISAPHRPARPKLSSVCGDPIAESAQPAHGNRLRLKLKKSRRAPTRKTVVVLDEELQNRLPYTHSCDCVVATRSDRVVVIKIRETAPLMVGQLARS